jgi:hypothetical protein
MVVYCSLPWFWSAFYVFSVCSMGIFLLKLRNEVPLLAIIFRTTDQIIVKPGALNSSRHARHNGATVEVSRLYGLAKSQKKLGSVDYTDPPLAGKGLIN